VLLSTGRRNTGLNLYWGYESRGLGRSLS
jgi:hypothetical protein